MSKGPKITIPCPDGTKKLIAYGANAMADLEEKLGESPIEVMRAMAKNAKADPEDRKMPSFSKLRAFVWAGVNGAGGDYSLREAGDLIDPKRLGDYWAAVSKAISYTLTGSTEPKEAPEETGDEADPTGGAESE